MPPTKRAATTSSTRTTARKPAQKPAKRTLSASHKQALTEGRTMSATVDRYLAAVNTPGRRGRKVPKAALVQRLATAQDQLQTGAGIARVVAAQEVRNLQARIAAVDSSAGADLQSLEAAFVKIAKQFGEQRGISYGAWRDAGVPADALKRAGIARTRG